METEDWYTKFFRGANHLQQKQCTDEIQKILFLNKISRNTYRRKKRPKILVSRSKWKAKVKNIKSLIIYIFES